MSDFLINVLPALFQDEGVLTVWGELFVGSLWFASFTVFGVLFGLFVYKRFRYAVTRLEKDNAKNFERFRVYGGAVDKQFRIHDELCE